MNKSIAERRWIWIFSLIVMALTSLPYLLGLWLQGPDWLFTGFIFGVDDGNSYIAKMLAGAEGAWLFRTPYTPYPQEGVLAFLPYLILGKLSFGAAPHLQLVLIFHLFRFAAGILAIFATYDFMVVFLPKIAQRRWGTLLAVLGGGLGWTLLLIGRSSLLGDLPLEFYSPESFGFLALYGLPHLSLARALLLWGLVVYLRLPPDPAQRAREQNLASRLRWLSINESQRWRSSGLLTGMLWLLMGLAQPLTVVVGWLILGGHFLAVLVLVRLERIIDSRIVSATFRKGAWVVLISSPIVLYTTVSFSQDPFLRAWTEQNRILSPHPVHYLLAYGAILPFSLLGIRPLMRNRPWRGGLLIAWLLIFPFLAYAPYNLQRRLPESIWLVFVILGVWGIERLRQKNQGLLRLRYLLLALILPSTLLLLIGGYTTLLNRNLPVFRPHKEVETFRWLAANVPQDSVVLAAFETANALPAWAPLRVVIGHGPESINFETLDPQVRAFFQRELGAAEEFHWLDSLGIDYVLWGPMERQLGGGRPLESPHLIRVFKAEDYIVFRVRGK